MKCSDIENTLKNYHITPDNLWVGFYTMSDAVRRFGAAPLEYSFCLATHSQQIYNANPNGVNACANLTEMKKNQQAIETHPILVADAKRFGIWNPEVFLVAAVVEEALTFYRVQAFTSEKAISYINQHNPQASIVATGSQNDFDLLIEQMENIQQSQIFSKISHDRRPSIDGLPSYKLLLCKINPQAFANAFFDELHPSPL